MTAYKKTLRLIFPDWQHGPNPSSGLVPRLMATIAPNSGSAETAEIPALDAGVEPTHVGLMEAQALSCLPEVDYHGYRKETHAIMEEKQPDRLISFSTDGAVTLFTADYLHGLYEDLGVLWIDAHREPVTPERFWKRRVIFSGAITGNQEVLEGLVQKPIPKDRFMFLTRKPDDIPPSDKAQFEHLGIELAGPDAVSRESGRITGWLKEKGIKHLIVHIDLDSVGSADLRSGIFREENLAAISAEHESAVPQFRKLFKQILQETDIVGFDLMEYELIQSSDFTALMADLPIFND